MSKSEAYVAYHGWVWLSNAINSHQFGLRVQVRLCHDNDLAIFEKIKKHRKKSAGSGMYRVMTKREDVEKWYGPVDMLYITWSHSISNGVTITFEMSSLSEWNRIRDSKAIKSGYEIDQLPKIEIMMIELDNEGKPINVKQRAKLEKMAAKRSWGKGGPRSKHAARLCQDAEFIAWYMELVNKGGAVPDTTPAAVAEWMRQKADIDSRAQLDHDPAALQRWEDRVYKPFLRSQME